MVRNILALCALAAPIALFACGSSTATTTSTGTGGSGSSSSSVGTGGTTASSTTSTTGSTTASTGSTTGTGGAAAGACINAADGAILNAPGNMVASEVGTCGQTNLAMEPATKNCIVMKTGLSDGCATCFDATVGCAAQNCFSACITDSGGACCAICRATHCDPAFAACSGITPAAPPPAPDGGC